MQNKKIILSLLFLLSASFPDQTECIDLISFTDSSEVLNYLRKYLPENPVILEAGAYDGGDTLRMQHLWPQATIYAFEPVPHAFKVLKQATSQYSNIHCYQMALSDKTGAAIFHLSSTPTNSQVTFSSSLLAPKEHLNYSNMQFTQIIEVPTISIDEWAAQQGVLKIDLMWLDMQGYELPVLMASSAILDTVSIIYTEVEFVEAYEGQYLYKDVVTWLENKGFKLVAKDFSENDNNRWYGNIIMTREK